MTSAALLRRDAGSIELCDLRRYTKEGVAEVEEMDNGNEERVKGGIPL